MDIIGISDIHRYFHGTAVLYHNTLSLCSVGDSIIRLTAVRQDTTPSRVVAVSPEMFCRGAEALWPVFGFRLLGNGVYYGRHQRVDFKKAPSASGMDFHSLQHSTIGVADLEMYRALFYPSWGGGVLSPFLAIIDGRAYFDVDNHCHYEDIRGGGVRLMPHNKLLHNLANYAAKETSHCRVEVAA